MPTHSANSTGSRPKPGMHWDGPSKRDTSPVHPLNASERERKETEEQLRKLRQRESEDFEYKKTQERKKAQDKYDEDQRLLEKRNKEKQEELERGWKQREDTLKAHEDELNQLRQESAGPATRLKAEGERATKEATRAAGWRFEPQIGPMKKDPAAYKRASELLANER